MNQVQLLILLHASLRLDLHFIETYETPRLIKMGLLCCYGTELRLTRRGQKLIGEVMMACEEAGLELALTASIKDRKTWRKHNGRGKRNSTSAS